MQPALTASNPAAQRRLEQARSAKAYGKAALAQTVCDTLRSAVVAFDSGTGALLFANAAFHASFAPTSASGAAWDAAAFERRILPAGAAVSPSAAAETELLDPQTGCWYAVHRHAAKGANGGLQVIELTDISQRLIEEDQRRSQHRQLLFTSKVMSVGEMAATLAHELNQPIGSLLNYLNGGLLRLERSRHARAPLDVEDLHGALVEARQQCERAAAIITRIREFVRTREPKMTVLALVDVFHSVVALLESEVRIHHIEAVTDVAAEVAPVRADRVMIEQVVHNLAKNAIEAMRHQAGTRRLVLSASMNADAMIEIAVLDSGPGVADSARDQLFSPFFTTKPDGLGIGLNICRSMIEFHGGSLFYSRPPTGGSRFCFTLPAGSDAAAATH